MERAKWTFEEQWHQALGEAEVAPRPQVWVAIDGQLANEQANDYKRLAFFYRRLAAACLVLMVIGATLYWQWGQSSSNSVVSNTEHSGDVISQPEISGSDHSQYAIISDSEDDAVEDAESAPTNDHQIADRAEASTTKSIASVATSEEDNSQVNSSDINPWVQNHQILSLNARSVVFPTSMKPWESEKLYGVPRTWEVISEDKLSGPLWAGVSFSAGAFDPGFGGNSGSDLVFANDESLLSEAVPTNQLVSASNPTYSTGQSIAGGLNIGKKVSKRVMLSGGLHYSAFNTGSSGSQLVGDGQNNTYALTRETSDSNLADALETGNLRYEGQQVQLANEFKYLTIPLKAGYVLLDKRFNITLNTGLASNILVDSRLVTQGETEDLSNDFSTSSSYENVYFNLLTSVEFGYIFKKHYHFLLEPNYNQALTDFTSSTNQNRARPRNIGLTIGFRYNF